MLAKLSLLLNAKKKKNASRPSFDQLVNFREKVHIEFTRKNFTVKTVETRRELAQALMLRFEVFHKEYMGKKFPIGIDLDRYDANADLLVIKDNTTNKVVGTYRFICSKFSEEFYSKSEFEMDAFLSQPGVKLELSRACIKKAYRKSTVLTYLWKGLAEYMKAVDARFLFGCSSVQIMDPNKICQFYKQLKEAKHLDPTFPLNTLPKYLVPNFEDHMEGRCDHASEPIEIPALLNSYLRAGAKIYGQPALDREFRCVDFLTVLDLTQLSKGHQRKFVD